MADWMAELEDGHGGQWE
ncbi:hypothetical protein CRE_01259 [Caenorhabditis remanei]|uniref:Uncharacterized protein n=1 Tax=Caenorhabditis remanei TaxID=31234 RepID=E3N9M2_CAERE|nr:hypothetical protein CRE_01259 [Caenorhabditis remanei]